MADINAIATQFTTFYYTTFDSDRANLASLYVGDHCLIACRLTQRHPARRVYADVGGHPDPGNESHS